MAKRKRAARLDYRVNRCGWRSWLNGITITLGMQNVFDEDPPFVAGAG